MSLGLRGFIFRNRMPPSRLWNVLNRWSLLTDRAKGGASDAHNFARLVSGSREYARISRLYEKDCTRYR